jgi:exosome complex component RRP43
MRLSALSRPGWLTSVFVSFPIRSTVLADPTAFEEPLLDTFISIVLDEHGSLLSTTQLGIADKDTMSACVAAAKERHETRGRVIYSF